MDFDLQFALSIIPELLRGLRVTVVATLASFAVAVFVGALVEAGRRASWASVRKFSAAYVSFIRCTPLLVQLYFAFYVLPTIGVRFSALVTGVACLGLHVGAYIAEVYRAGINSVAVGQWEGAKSLGLPQSVIWRKIILPQALPPMLPPLGNYFIGLFKETPLLAAITVIDLFGAANAVAGRTFRYNEPYTVAALMLLSISLTAAYALHLAERPRKNAR